MEVKTTTTLWTWKAGLRSVVRFGKEAVFRDQVIRVSCPNFLTFAVTLYFSSFVAVTRFFDSRNKWRKSHPYAVNAQRISNHQDIVLEWEGLFQNKRHSSIHKHKYDSWLVRLSDGRISRSVAVIVFYCLWIPWRQSSAPFFQIPIQP